MKSPSLYITPPPVSPNEEDKAALAVIHQLSKIMARKSTVQTLNHRIDALKDDSVRRIQGGRYEIFVSDATDKPSTCFDQIVTRDQSWLPLSTKEILVNYAIRQAQQNPDIARYGEDYKFGNFSLLVNGRNAQQQPHHIDMVSPNSQFGLMLTPNSPGTLVYHVHDSVETVYDIKRIWNAWNDPQLPFLDNLVTAFRSSNEATMLVQQFGNILLPEESMEEQPVSQEIPAGSLMTLPGGIIHAGPHSSEGRTVLFFSGCPSNKEQPPYHPDTQYSALFLCGQLVDILWQSPGVGQEEREYLLRMLVKYQRQSNVKRKLASHFPEGGVKPFIVELEENPNLMDETKLEEYITKTAQDNMYCLYNVEGDFEQVSVEGLLTQWEGMELNLVVYRRTFDDKILLHYPNITEGSWEGGNSGETYTLTMNENETLAFDGSNGKLVDNDGDVIRCYTRRRQKEKQPKKPRIVK